MQTHLLIAASAVVALATPAFAFAHPVTEQADGLRQVVVPYGDLNLNTADGQTILNQRIRFAAEQACGERPDSKDLRQTHEFDSCMRKSTETAIAAIPSARQLAGTNRPHG